jgi:hypothetical protein
MARTKVFVSFDFDNDRVLRDFIIGQARHPGSPFEVSDYSLKEPARQAIWESKARAAIRRADKLVVMLGPQTRFAPGVKKEVAMARSLGKPMFQVIGYRRGSRMWAVPGAGRVYLWDWSALSRLLTPPTTTFAERFLRS